MEGSRDKTLATARSVDTRSVWGVPAESPFTEIIRETERKRVSHLMAGSRNKTLVGKTFKYQTSIIDIMTRDDADQAGSRNGGEVYTVQKHEFESLNEIKRMIRSNLYTDLKDVREHLDFLERTAGRLNTIFANEQKEGMIDLDTPKFIKEVKQTYDNLYDLYSKMLEKLPKDHKEIQKRKKKSATVTGLSTSSLGSARF